MNRLVSVALVLAAGCGLHADWNPDELPDGGSGTSVTVRGTVQFHPLELEFRDGPGGAGLSPLPSLDGLPLEIESLDTAQQGRPALRRVETSLSGAFTARVVADGPLFVTVSADSAYFVPTSTVVEPDTNVVAYVLTAAFVNALESAAGASFNAFIDDGVVFGRVVDARSSGVRGALLATGSPAQPVRSSSGEPLVYLSGDLRTSVTGATSDSGAFVYQPAASVLRDYTAVRAGESFASQPSLRRGGFVTILEIAAQ